jgi:hypothetical protein
MSTQKPNNCSTCGMACRPGEYHPYAACLMFKATKDERAVRMNLSKVIDWAKQQQTSEVTANAESLTINGRDSRTSDEEKAFIRRYASFLGELVDRHGPASAEVREHMAAVIGDLDAATLREAGASPSDRQRIAEAIECQNKVRANR